MPWDGTELWIGRFDAAAGTLADARVLAGGPDESITQPEWSPDGHLHCLTDRSNWWNVVRFERDADGAPVGFPVPLPPVEAEIGLPAWVFGRSRYGFLDDGRVVCAFTQGAHVHLGIVDPAEHAMSVHDTRLATFEALRVRGETVVGIGGGFASEAAVVAFDLASVGSASDSAAGSGGAALHAEVLRPPRDLGLDPDVISLPEPITHPTSGGREAHGRRGRFHCRPPTFRSQQSTYDPQSRRNSSLGVGSARETAIRTSGEVPTLRTRTTGRRASGSIEPRVKRRQMPDLHASSATPSSTTTIASRAPHASTSSSSLGATRSTRR